MRVIKCRDIEEANEIEAAISKASGITFPYTTPINPEDRIGYDDGSVVSIERITAPIITEKINKA